MSNDAKKISKRIISGGCFHLPLPKIGFRWRRTESTGRKDENNKHRQEMNASSQDVSKMVTLM